MTFWKLRLPAFPLLSSRLLVAVKLSASLSPDLDGLLLVLLSFPPVSQFPQHSWFSPSPFSVPRCLPLVLVLHPLLLDSPPTIAPPFPLLQLPSPLLVPKQALLFLSSIHSFHQKLKACHEQGMKLSPRRNRRAWHIKLMDQELKTRKCNSHHHCFLVTWPYANYLTSWFLNFLICNWI